MVDEKVIFFNGEDNGWLIFANECKRTVGSVIANVRERPTMSLLPMNTEGTFKHVRKTPAIYTSCFSTRTRCLFDWKNIMQMQAA